MNMYITKSKVIVHGILNDETITLTRAWAAPTKLGATRMAREHAKEIMQGSIVPWFFDDIEITETKAL